MGRHFLLVAVRLLLAVLIMSFMEQSAHTGEEIEEVGG
jgi:hypothetical protein